ncbi:regulatory signaling modulator protein AmpE [Glaciecola sp. XM2]|uniref:regulatory signaling modulator protein AmpE n=1 Tax=Glaciecola sp. XM2 TaxID=1914931 RepID=UPI001BDE99EC|nr:regulatory signaling modulator protein AmpE [Glaciecola sp. XM2]
MTLLSLLIVMALERVTNKSKQFHIATLAESYFNILINREYVKERPNMLASVMLALIPALLLYIVLSWLPILAVFIANVFVLWVCLGCPVTRKTYKQYLQAAHREDFQACALHSMSFGNEGGALSNVGKQLVLVNYRQYASVILFFILLGAPGVVFYSLVKEWAVQQKKRAEQNVLTMNDDTSDEDDAQPSAPTQEEIEAKLSANKEVTPLAPNDSAVNKLLFIIDWIPVRITAFGFLVVGHFTNAMSAWFEILLNPSISTYDALAKVSKAAEDVSTMDEHLTEPLQLVKLVKRNVVFILMSVSLLTMVGLVA